MEFLGEANELGYYAGDEPGEGFEEPGEFKEDEGIRPADGFEELAEVVGEYGPPPAYSVEPGEEPSSGMTDLSFIRGVVKSIVSQIPPAYGEDFAFYEESLNFHEFFKTGWEGYEDESIEEEWAKTREVTFDFLQSTSESDTVDMSSREIIKALRRATPLQSEIEVRRLKEKSAVLRKRVTQALNEIAKEDEIGRLIQPLMSREPYHSYDRVAKEYSIIAPYLPDLAMNHTKIDYTGLMEIPDYRQYGESDSEFYRAFCDALEPVKRFTKANDAHVYIIENNKIYRHTDDKCNRYPTKWDIGPGTIIAAYVAYSHQCMILHEGQFTDKRFPVGLGRTGPLPDSMICIPCITPEGKVNVVLEFDRTDGGQFTKEDLNYAIAVGSWLDAALSRRKVRAQHIIAASYRESLFGCMLPFMRGHVEIYELVSKLMSIMREFVGAEDVMYYSNVKGSRQEGDLFELSPELNENNQPILIRKKLKRKSDKLLNKVMNERVVLNLNKEELTLYPVPPSIHSLAYIPIGTASRILGVVKLINKKNGAAFTKGDVINAEACGTYCASSLFYNALSMQLRKTIEINAHEKPVLRTHMAACRHEIEVFRSRPALKPPPYYLSFQWYPSEEELNHDTLRDYLWWMFKDLYEGDVFMDKFDKFLHMVRRNYLNNFYHNFEHAFSATHTMFVTIRTSSHRYNYLEQLAMMVAILCHDVGHPGITNNFIRLSGDALSVLYRDSFLENHHSYMTKHILQASELFSHFVPADQAYLKSTIHHLIMATDLKFYFRKRLLMIEMLKKGSTDEVSPVDQHLKKYLLMTACDLSGQSKPYKVTRRLTMNLYKELYLEGDRTRNLGYTPFKVMDRTQYTNIPYDQVSFLTEVVIPCMKLVSQVFPDLKDLYLLSCANCDYWRGEFFPKVSEIERLRNESATQQQHIASLE